MEERDVSDDWCEEESKTRDVQRRVGRSSLDFSSFPRFLFIYTLKQKVFTFSSFLINIHLQVGNFCKKCKTFTVVI